MHRFIFILPNIYEITNGVSKKYISFLQFLSQQSNIHVTVFLTKTKKSNISFPKLPHIHFHLVKGIRVPYYPEIKVPFITHSELSKHMITNHEIILFHGEFFWLYDTMEKLYKEHPSIHIFANWHTDYEYYLEHFYKNRSFLPKIFDFQSLLQRLYQMLEKKIFYGIVVTGPLMVKQFSSFTSSVFNANEIDLSIYHKYKFEINYDLIHHKPNQFHGFYCGRMSCEKNIHLIPSYLSVLQKTIDIPIHMHMIGGGPDLEDFKKQVLNENVHYHFYGSLSSEEIFSLYMRFENRFFLFCSTSETFGKSPFEAGACGIPLFIYESRITSDLFKNEENAFIFHDTDSWIQQFLKYWNWNSKIKEKFLFQSYLNTQTYHQQFIFDKWFHFMISSPQKKKEMNWLQSLSFKTIAQAIQCSGDFFGEK